MKKLLLSALALCIAGTIAAQESPLWMRYCTISPDGTTIAFTYKGDIYTVPSTGGQATQILPMTLLLYGVLTENKLLLLPTVWEVWMCSSYQAKEELPND